ncbi:MAG: hypothetical protein ACM3X4_02385 [Ignavibacteriales bacterium]
MIMLVDAMVLIDLEYVGGISLLPQIGATEVMDVVLAECIHPSQPLLESHVRAAGISVIRSQTEWLFEALALKTDALSAQDSLNLFYARTFGRTLLTNEKALRQMCERLCVRAHGTLWLIEQAFTGNLLPAAELCRWLRALPEFGRRLPRTETHRLSRLLGC